MQGNHRGSADPHGLKYVIKVKVRGKDGERWDVLPDRYDSADEADVTAVLYRDHVAGVLDIKIDRVYEDPEPLNRPFEGLRRLRIGERA